MNVRLHFTTLQRVRIGYAALLLIFGIFLVRLFYLQVIRHDDYTETALIKQLKEYQIPAQRGIIAAQSANGVVPIVLNDVKYTIFADPFYIDNVGDASVKIAEVLGGSPDDYKELLERESRYSILAKKQSEEVKEQIESLELKGVGAREAIYRTYPQGTLAAQMLGFVNAAGEGRYGLEEALQDRLKGEPGLVKAITDAQGVPLAANEENTLIEPQPGDKAVLTIDIGMQQGLESLLAKGVKASKAPSGGAIIMEIATGKVKAMANYPTYDPARFSDVAKENVGLFENKVVSSPLEVGSIMKPLTMAAALDQGVINRNTTYYDAYRYVVDGEEITNVPGSGRPGVKRLRDILQLSLNTGATWLLMQMGGGEINQQARERWYDYMVNHYQFGKKTGIEQGFEASGVIPDPNEGFGLNIKYANTAFGQGMTATPLQMAAAFTAVLNGGTYYRPQLVEYFKKANGEKEYVQPEIVHDQVVKPEVSEDIVEIMEYAFSINHAAYGMEQLREQYSIGNKTGTAQVPRPDGGGYYEDRENGMFVGYVGGDKPQYLIIVRVDTPQIAGYAGSKAAGPIFIGLANMLIDNFGVVPRTQ